MNTNQANQLLNEALAELWQGRPANAAKLLEQAVIKVEIAIAQQRWTEALELASQVAYLAPGTRRIHFLMGICKARLGAASEALQSFDIELSRNHQNLACLREREKLGPASALRSPQNSAASGTCASQAVHDFSKSFFMEAWGDGYYAADDVHGGSDAVLEAVCIDPFRSTSKVALEIGPGGGRWSQRLFGFKRLILVDVIPKSKRITIPCEYIELPEADYSLPGVPDDSVDYLFCWGVFCHLSRTAVTTYLEAINRVARKGFNAIIMFGDWPRVPSLKDIPNPEQWIDHVYELGWAYQTTELCNEWVRQAGFEIVNNNIFPAWQDCAVHFRKV